MNASIFKIYSGIEPYGLPLAATTVIPYSAARSIAFLTTGESVLFDFNVVPSRSSASNLIFIPSPKIIKALPFDSASVKGQIP